MNTHRDLSLLLSQGGLREPAAVTVGMFDGVHVGHQSLLRELRAWALEAGALPRVVTFDRHPQQVLTGSGPAMISSLEHRLVLLEREGISDTLVLSFDRALSGWPAEEFVRKVVVEALCGRKLLLGFDSALGHRRQGDFQYLKDRAGDLGIDLRQSRIETLSGQRVSSTLVRQALAAGDLSRLEALLDRPFALLGKVGHGDGRGRRIGFPTANVDVLGASLPPLGVYVAEVLLIDHPGSQAIPAVVNIGIRPTFKDSSASQAVVEAHLLDWGGDLYGQTVEVRLLARSRPEMKFASAEQLIAQIQKDIAAAREFFRQAP